MCGVVGIHGLPSEVAKQTYFALFAVQHRGQESAGIATSDGHDLHEHSGMGLVSRVFTEEDLEALPGFISIGHCGRGRADRTRSRQGHR
jgi:amidophosphoribosyltransferase